VTHPLSPVDLMLQLLIPFLNVAATEGGAICEGSGSWLPGFGFCCEGSLPSIPSNIMINPTQPKKAVLATKCLRTERCEGSIAFKHLICGFVIYTFGC
jgi:hypothetical protein